MRTPIAYTLGWPQRIDAPTARLDLAKLGSLTFEAPDMTRFPSLRLARDVLKAGGAAPTVLNAANEVAVGRYLNGEIGFLDIAANVEHALARVKAAALTTLDDILNADGEARRIAKEFKRLPSAAE